MYDTDNKRFENNDEVNRMKKTVWIDIINPSHPLFFNSIINDLSKDNEIEITLRNRGETIKLAKQLLINGKIIGSDYENPIQKTLSIFTRTLNLSIKVPYFDIALSFENPMSVAVSKIRMKKSILMLDNDLKFKIKRNFIQSMESYIKKKADYVMVPEVCRDLFSKHVKRDKLLTYDGYKEDIYISEYIQDPFFKDKIPFSDYFVIRPEAFASFYVKSNESLVSPIIKALTDIGENIVLLPRDKSDKRFLGGSNVYIPREPLNGLDLIKHSKGVLTGSGTMAREAAIMSKNSASFFPNNNLLSVDMSLIEKGRMIHSRNVKILIDHITKNQIGIFKRDSKKVKNDVINILRDLISD